MVDIQVIATVCCMCSAYYSVCESVAIVCESVAIVLLSAVIVQAANVLLKHVSSLQDVSSCGATGAGVCSQWKSK